MRHMIQEISKEQLRAMFPAGNLTRTRRRAGTLNLAIRAGQIEGVIGLEDLAMLIMPDVYEASSIRAKREHLRDMKRVVRKLADKSAEISRNNPGLGFAIIPAPESLAKISFRKLRGLSSEIIYTKYYRPGWRATHAYISFHPNGNVEGAWVRGHQLCADGVLSKSKERLEGWTHAGLLKNPETHTLPK